MKKYKIIKEQNTTGRNHNNAYSIKNYLTKDFNEKFSVVVTELKDGEHELTKNISSDRVYYFITANALFKIDDDVIPVTDGDVLFIEKDTFYSFKGSFKAVLMSLPAFDIENDVNISQE
jgi:mannose-6-phosphate isomerase-like protein (cupin superfamily)